MTTVYNYYINVADWETETVKFAGETVEEAEKYAVMAGFEITGPTVKAEVQTTGRILNVITGELEPVEEAQTMNTYTFKTTSGIKRIRTENEAKARTFVSDPSATLVEVKENTESPYKYGSYEAWCDAMGFAPH